MRNGKKVIIWFAAGAGVGLLIELVVLVGLCVQFFGLPTGLAGKSFGIFRIPGQAMGFLTVTSLIVCAVLAVCLGLLIVRKITKRGVSYEVDIESLPGGVREFIESIVKKVRYRKSVRAEVREELAAHFEDELEDLEGEGRESRARELISQFGDISVLAKLIRRGKKRCRPLAIRALAGCILGVEILLVCFAFYTVWFINGEPAIETDYLALLNQKQRDLKVGLTEENNAWFDYEKGVELFVEPTDEISDLVKRSKKVPYEGNLTDEENALAMQWLRANEGAWGHLAAGSRKRYCYFQSEYESENKEKRLGNHAYPIHFFWRHLRDLGLLRMRMALERGHAEEAVESCLVMMRVVPQLAKKSYYLVEHMMASLSMREGLNHLLYIISTNEFSAEELNNLHEQVSSLFPEGYPDLSLCLEAEYKILRLDLIQHIFTSNGIGGGHMIPQKFNGFEKQSKTGRFVLNTAVSMVHAGRDETIATINEAYEYMAEQGRKSPYERLISENIFEEYILSLPVHRNFLLRMSIPIMRGRIESVFQTKVYYEAGVTILAVLRWKLENEMYPESLKQLIEEDYLRNLPQDPYSAGALVYKQRGESFTLYSVGPNFEDDGGEYGSNINGEPEKWGVKGDEVFWPVVR